MRCSASWRLAGFLSRVVLFQSSSTIQAERCVFFFVSCSACTRLFLLQPLLSWTWAGLSMVDPVGHTAAVFEVRVSISCTALCQ